MRHHAWLCSCGSPVAHAFLHVHVAWRSVLRMLAHGCSQLLLAYPGILSLMRPLPYRPGCSCPVPTAVQPAGPGSGALRDGVWRPRTPGGAARDPRQGGG